MYSPAACSVRISSSQSAFRMFFVQEKSLYGNSMSANAVLKEVISTKCEANK